MPCGDALRRCLQEVRCKAPRTGRCSDPDKLMYNSLTASQICSFLFKLKCSQDAFEDSDPQPLGQANVQPLTSWCTTLWQPAKYAVSWSGWSVAKIPSRSPMRSPSDKPMFSLWRADVQLFDSQPNMQFPGQAEVQTLGARSEVSY